MGRPIQKKWFGDLSQDGLQIELKAFVPGAAAAEECHIIKQRSTSAYYVENASGDIGTVRLVDKNAIGDLAEGEAFLLVELEDGSQFPAKKITQRRVTFFGTAGVVGTKDWNSIVADEVEEGDIFADGSDSDSGGALDPAEGMIRVDTVDGGGAILTFTIIQGGAGYDNADAVADNILQNTISGGTGDGTAEFRPTSVDGAGNIDALDLRNSGSGYTAGDMLNVTWVVL